MWRLHFSPGGTKGLEDKGVQTPCERVLFLRKWQFFPSLVPFGCGLSPGLDHFHRMSAGEQLGPRAVGCTHLCPTAGEAEVFMLPTLLSLSSIFFFGYLLYFLLCVGRRAVSPLNHT